MTDLPYGRGGSPLQNLIANGHKITQLTALKMTTELDAGPIYLKEPIALNGSAQDVFLQCAKLIYKLVNELIHQKISPKDQEGEIVNFTRRTPQQSKLPQQANIEKIYDIIRMLDAPSYPKAFLDYGNFTLTFEDAILLTDSHIEAKVSISSRQKLNKKTNKERT